MTGPRLDTANASSALPRVLVAGRGRAAVASKEVRSLLSGGSPVWVDLDLSDPAQARALREDFGLPPFAVQSALDPDSRVSLEEFEGVLFFTIRAISFCEETEDDPYDLETSNVAMFVGPTFLITAHFGAMPALDEIAEHADRSPAALAAGPARMAQALVEATISAYFPLLDQIEEFVDGLEERVFGKFDDEALHDIFQVKRVVLTLRRHLAPERDVLARLANRPSSLIPPDTQMYFRASYDHVLRLTEALDTYRELMSSTLESFLTQISNRLGSITKALSTVATVSIPLVVISGMWGMNFDRIPLSAHPWGFWILVVAQLALALALVLALRTRRLL